MFVIFAEQGTLAAWRGLRLEQGPRQLALPND
jgi:hypothetical protein